MILHKKSLVNEFTNKICINSFALFLSTFELSLVLVLLCGEISKAFDGVSGELSDIVFILIPVIDAVSIL